MQPASVIVFPPFRLDQANERLWRGEQPIHLRPKTFAVLRCLLEHAGQLLTKSVLLNTVWPDTVVSEAVLLGCIRDLRQALGDDPRHPQFIETIHRRGYRFIGSIAVAPVPTERPGTHGAGTPGTMVGREAELAALHQYRNTAWAGTRQMVFVTGEAGLGKTTLLDAFVTEARHLGPMWTGRGQCIEHFGAGEAYMPVLEALGQLCRAPQGHDLVGLLAQQAPTWLVQMPWLLSPADLDRLQHSLFGTTRERMLREMAHVLEILTVERPLLLVLEDLHWSDYATLDLLAMLARRQELARLLVLGTYRPEEVVGQGHPLQTVTQELRLHGRCAEVPLRFLTQAAVATYLRARLPQTPLVEGLARFIHERTDGNPLFLVNMVDEILSRNLTEWTPAAQREAEKLVLPENLRQLLEQRFERLRPEEQRVLEVGSVVGVEFAAALVAAGLDAEVEQAEAWCEALARRQQWLRTQGQSAWPDGTVSGRYGFIHALYQDMVYSRVTAARRRRLHQRIGERLAAGHAAQAPELAAELALHFERGRDYQRAVHYCQHAAEHALQRYAYREATTHLTKGLELLTTLPVGPERAKQELQLHLALFTSLSATQGPGSPDLEPVLTRARELSQQVGDLAQRFRILTSLRSIHATRAELHTSREIDETLLQVAQECQDPVFLLDAHRFMGHVLLHLGELPAARRHFESGLAVRASQPPLTPRRLSAIGQDPLMVTLAFLAYTLWLLGYPDQAAARTEEAIMLAQHLGHPTNLIFALHYVVRMHRWQGNRRLAQERTEASLTLASKYGFTQLMAQGTFLQGLLLTEQGRDEAGLALMRQGLEAYWATGARLRQTMYLADLAAGYAKAGHIEAGLMTLAEALTQVQQTAECWYEAELYRLQGELHLLRCADQQQAAACFEHALEIARQQHAKSWELCAATSLARLWQQQGKPQEAYDLLVPVYNWYTEGFDTVDLQKAQALLRALAS